MLNETDINTLAKATKDGKVVYLGYVTDYLDINNARGVAVEGYEDAPHVTLLCVGDKPQTFYAADCELLSVDEGNRYMEAVTRHAMSGVDTLLKIVIEDK